MENVYRIYINNDESNLFILHLWIFHITTITMSNSKTPARTHPIIQ